jgi:hypothetical protein
MTPAESARTLALQLAINAVKAQNARVQKRTAFLFSDALATEAIQATLLGLQSATPARVADEEDLTNIDPGVEDKQPTTIVAVARALSLVTPETSSESSPSSRSDSGEQADTGETPANGEGGRKDIAA